MVDDLVKIAIDGFIANMLNKQIIKCFKKGYCASKEVIYHCGSGQSLKCINQAPPRALAIEVRDMFKKGKIDLKHANSILEHIEMELIDPEVKE